MEEDGEEEAGGGRTAMSAPAGQSMRAGDAGPGRVMVVGASGKLGRAVTAELVSRGRSVTAVSRGDVSMDGLDGLDTASVRVLSGRDDVGNLSADDFEGVSSVVCCVGATRESPAEVTEGGVVLDLIASSEAHLPSTAGWGGTSAAVIALDADGKFWRNIDDTIMGGQSRSTPLQTYAKPKCGVVGTWSGDLVFEGGGFCGIRSPMIAEEAVQLEGAAGLTFRVRVAGGSRTGPIRLKATVKTKDYIDRNEYAYQSSFVVTDSFSTIQLPFDSFVAVKKANTVPDAPPLRGADIRQVGFVYSRFEVNGLRNRECQSGHFSIDFGSPIALYKADLPSFVMVSSAGVERNALCDGDEERRSREIPIVRLNPGGVLNYKYKAEIVLRNSSLGYCIVRPTGLVDDLAEEEAPLELSQGDLITGRLTRKDVAGVVATALGSAHARNKTFEVRRADAATSRCDLPSMLKRMADDWSRASNGIRPFPAYAPPPAPPDEETVREILEQVAVIQSAAE